MRLIVFAEFLPYLARAPRTSPTRCAYPHKADLHSRVPITHVRAFGVRLLMFDEAWENLLRTGTLLFPKSEHALLFVCSPAVAQRDMPSAHDGRLRMYPSAPRRHSRVP